MATLPSIKGFLQYRKEMLARYPNKNNRMRGISTAQALEAIAEAIKNPESEILLKDHASYYHPEANECLMKTTVSIIERLNLEGFTFKKRKTWYLKFSFEQK